MNLLLAAPSPFPSMGNFFCQDCKSKARIEGEARFCSFCGKERLIEVFGKDEAPPPVKPATYLDDEPSPVRSHVPSVVAAGIAIGYLLTQIGEPEAKPKRKRRRKRRKK